MKSTTVSIRELKSRRSHYLRLAKAGRTVEITERGVPIGRIVPSAMPVEDRVEAMTRSGLLAWNEHKLARLVNRDADQALGAEHRAVLHRAPDLALGAAPHHLKRRAGIGRLGNEIGKLLHRVRSMKADAHMTGH